MRQGCMNTIGMASTPHTAGDASSLASTREAENPAMIRAKARRDQLRAQNKAVEPGRFPEPQLQRRASTQLMAHSVLPPIPGAQSNGRPLAGTAMANRKMSDDTSGASSDLTKDKPTLVRAKSLPSLLVPFRDGSGSVRNSIQQNAQGEFLKGRKAVGSLTVPTGSATTVIPNSAHTFTRPEKKRERHSNMNKLVKKGPMMAL